MTTQAERALQCEIQLRLRAWPVISSEQPPEFPHEVDWVLPVFGLIAARAKQLQISGVGRASQSDRHDVVDVLAAAKGLSANRAFPALRFVDPVDIGRSEGAVAVIHSSATTVFYAYADSNAFGCFPVEASALFYIETATKAAQVLPIAGANIGPCHIRAGVISVFRRSCASAGQHLRAGFAFRLLALKFLALPVAGPFPISAADRAATRLAFGLVGVVSPGSEQAKFGYRLSLAAELAKFGLGYRVIISHVDRFLIGVVRGVGSLMTGRRLATVSGGAP